MGQLAWLCHVGSLLLLNAFIVNITYSQSATEDIQAKLNAIHSMSAHFSQVVKAGKRDVSHSSGTMALRRPGKFRWQTNSPMEQIMVADGKKLWVYDVELEQVTVRVQKQGVGGTPGLFLSGYDENTVARDFNVNKTEKGSHQIYELQAKSHHENYRKVIFTYTNNTLMLIEFFDELGQHTIISLSQQQNNPTLADHLFQFKPPKGVDVIQQ